MKRINYPTRLWVGQDALKRLTDFKKQKILLVTDKVMVTFDSFKKIQASIEEQNECAIFSSVVPDPPIEVVMAGIQLLTEFKPDVIIAVGGGSVIDAAKGINFFAKKAGKIQDTLFIAIPTTSGTGSEVTNFAVITDEIEKQKYPLVMDEIQPDEAILTSELLLSIPPSVTADTGMDVLTHIIEAYVSTENNDFSDALCEKALKLVFEYLPICFHEGHNVEAREKMHSASTMAGMAFNTTSLGLNHGIAHALGGKYHIPHGRINAVLLTEVIQYNAGYGQYDQYFDVKTAKRYSKLATILTQEEFAPKMGVRKLISLINNLAKQVKIPEKLDLENTTSDSFEKELVLIAAGAIKDGCTKTNPRTPSKDDIIKIMKAVY